MSYIRPIERWAIRHIPTGNLMPLTLKRHTESEPQVDCVPRFFDSKSSASSALNRWLEGIWRLHYYPGGYECDADIEWGPEKPEYPRIKEDMEIIKVKLILEII